MMDSCGEKSGNRLRRSRSRCKEAGAMRFGVNTFIWESPLSTAHVEPLADKAAQLGCQVLELACEDPALIDFPRVRDVLAARGLEPIVCGAFGPGRDISSDDPANREGGIAYIRQLIDAAAVLGAGLVCGPLYSHTGKARLLPDEERRAERRRAAPAPRGRGGGAGAGGAGPGP